MRVTKYPQSCLLLEKNNQRIVIDPGNFFTAKYKVNDLGNISAVLYTHQHADHFDESIVGDFKAKNVPLYGNSAVTSLIGEGAQTVESGKSFTVAGFEILPHNLPHCLLPDGSEGPLNTGYIIDGNFFHPGDGIKTESFEIDNLALPITGPDISFLDAIQFSKDLQAKTVIPMHYHGIEIKPESFMKYFEWGGGSAKVIILEDGQSAEL